MLVLSASLSGVNSEQRMRTGRRGAIISLDHSVDQREAEPNAEEMDPNGHRELVIPSHVREIFKDLLERHSQLQLEKEIENLRDGVEEPSFIKKESYDFLRELWNSPSKGGNYVLHVFSVYSKSEKVEVPFR